MPCSSHSALKPYLGHIGDLSNPCGRGARVEPIGLDYLALSFFALILLER
jgi:hypothetical protein